MDDENCNICEMQFPHATPNKAVADGPLVGGNGMWAYACTSHKSYIVILR